MTRARLLLVAVVLLLLGGAAAPAAAAEEPIPESSSGPYLGPVLDWTKDSAREYADDLGATPSVYAQSVRYPMDEDDHLYLQQFVDQAAQQGALAMVTLEPIKPLTELTEGDAADLVDQLQQLHERDDSRFLIRFAPEMNGSWRAWGQQSEAYVDAFRTIATAVHADVPQAAMLWAPVYGSGYPFDRSAGSTDGTSPRDQLEIGDDPYAPYWPGADAVDWVGLVTYHFGNLDDDRTTTEFTPNQVPEAGAFVDRLEDRYGYAPGTSPASFYATYAEGQDKPMTVETSALYAPGAGGGATELAIKQAWWDQVFSDEVRQQYPRLQMVTWLEQKRPEDAVQGRDVDWRATHTDDLAAAFLADAKSHGMRLGPVTAVLDQDAGNSASNQYREDGIDPGDHMGWIVGCVTLAVALYLFSGVAGRFIRSWRYPRENDPRDARLDFLRGWVIVAVVVTHIEVAGPYSFITLNATGAITGAEMFVLLSGLVLGMVYPMGVARMGEYATAVGAFRRARKQYFTALGVVILVYLIGLLPGVSAAAVTTFTDRGTGSAGSGAQGQVYDLYANVARLLDYPPPWYAVKQLLLLEMGPWVFNIMGLFVVLSLLVPPLMWLIQRKLWWLVLAVSWGLYVLDAVHHVRVLPSQFEDVFPLLTWQIAFTHGLVIGYYRRQITRALTSRVGVALVTIAMVAYAGVLLFLWAGQSDTYFGLYERFYQRTDLQPGRLLDLLLILVASYALLTACWKPLNQAFGWFFVPLGTFSLYVFIVHVFFVVAVANVPGLDRMSLWQGTLVHTAVLALIWLMVRKRFLMKIIPT